MAELMTRIDMRVAWWWGQTDDGDGDEGGDVMAAELIRDSDE